MQDYYKPEPIKYVDFQIVRKTLQRYEENAFAQFLYLTFPEWKVNEVIQEYHLGTAKDFGTIFWHKDDRGFRTGKLMFYDILSGKRFKDINPSYLFTSSQGYSVPLFGEHLLSKYPKAVVNIVESEKTAIICAICSEMLGYSNSIWLASGGANGLSGQKMMALKGRIVKLFDDIDQAGAIGYEKPFEKLKSIAYKVKRINDYSTVQGSDLADLILSEIGKNRNLLSQIGNKITENLPIITESTLILGENGYPKTWD